MISKHRFGPKMMAALTALLVFTSLLIAVPARAQFASQTQYVATVGGTANAVTLTVPNVSALSDLLGVQLLFKPTATNSTAVTINAGALGVFSLLKPSPSGLTALTGSELVTGQMTGVVWDGVEFALVTNVNASAVPVITPQGYLTPCQVSSGSPVTGCTAGAILPTGDVTAATTLYYEPMVGNQIPIYNGNTTVMFTFSEMTLTIPSSRLANTIYDACITTTTAGAYSATGSPTIVFSVAWTTSTAGSGARGTGAGTAQIVQVNGVWTNSVSFNGVNGATTISGIPANTCTVIGTVLVDATNGQVSFTRTYGQSRKWSTFNFYNRQQINLQVGDATSTWSTNAVSYPTFRESRGQTTNFAAIVRGLPDEGADISFAQDCSTSGAGVGCYIGIGINSTTAASGQVGLGFNIGAQNTTIARHTLTPFIGLNNINALESQLNGTGTFFGTNAFMLMLVGIRG